MSTISETTIIDLLQEIKDLSTIVNPDLELLRAKVASLGDKCVYEPVKGFQFKLNLDFQTKQIESYSLIVKPDMIDMRSTKRFTKEELKQIVDFLNNFLE